MAATQIEQRRWTSPTDLIACEPLRALKTLTPSNSFKRLSARATASASDSTDSGYATLSDTPNDAVKANQSTFTVSASFPKRLFKKNIVLREYEHLEISDIEWARFRDLQRLIFGRPLFEYIAEKHSKLLRHNMGQLLECSFRLVVLGENEASATSRILVQCDKIVAKTVRQYFCQPNIREQYECPEEHNLFPSLKLHVFDRAPVKRAATGPIRIRLTYDYLYKPDRTFVKVENGIGARYATIGGAVEITGHDGSVKRWNLTVGHLFDENLPDNSHLAPSHPGAEAVTEHQSTSSFGENEHCCSDNTSQIRDDGMDSETQFVLEEDSTTAHLRSGICSSSVESLSVMYPTPFDKCTEALAVTAGHGVPLSHRNYDWAIIDAPRVNPCPFGLPSEGPHAASQQTRQVVFHSGTGGAQTGILSKRPTFVMSGVDGSVVENYTLRLRDRPGTRPGDCGSWVIDIEDNVVYGYVIASDALGDVYVMPMDAVLQDIKSALGAQHVKLYQLPELPPLSASPFIQAQSTTRERSEDSGYYTASFTAHTPVRVPGDRLLGLYSFPCWPDDAISVRSAESYACGHYNASNRPRSAPPSLLHNEVPSNFTSPYEDSTSPSEVIVDRQPEIIIDEQPQVVLDEQPQVILNEQPDVLVEEQPAVFFNEQRELTESFNIPKDEGQPRRPQPSRWRTTKNAVSMFKSIFRGGNNERRSKKKSIADTGPQAIQSKK